MHSLNKYAKYVEFSIRFPANELLKLGWNLDSDNYDGYTCNIKLTNERGKNVAYYSIETNKNILNGIDNSELCECDFEQTVLDLIELHENGIIDIYTITKCYKSLYSASDNSTDEVGNNIKTFIYV